MTLLCVSGKLTEILNFFIPYSYPGHSGPSSRLQPSRSRIHTEYRVSVGQTRVKYLPTGALYPRFPTQVVMRSLDVVSTFE